MKRKSPSLTIIMMTAYASIETSIEAIKRGAYYYITKPINMEELLLLIMRALEFKQLSYQLETLHEELEQRRGNETFLGKSKAMQRVFSMIDRIKDIDSSVLITGESGTGKELVARSIHNTGKRKNGPLEIVIVRQFQKHYLNQSCLVMKKVPLQVRYNGKRESGLPQMGGHYFLMK